MSIIFRRIRGHIVPIKTDGAREKGKRGDVSGAIGKTVVAAGTAGGAYYVTAQKAHGFFTSAAERLDKWLGKAFGVSQRVANAPVAPLHKAGSRGGVKAVRLKKDGTPYKTRAKKAPAVAPGQGTLFGEGKAFKPANAAPASSADDVLKFGKQTIRRERIGKFASRIGGAAKAGAARLGILKKYSPVAAGAIGLAVGGAVLYNELKQARIIRRRK